jgi:hypothetical protein
MVVGLFLTSVALIFWGTKRASGRRVVSEQAGDQASPLRAATSATPKKEPAVETAGRAQPKLRNSGDVNPNAARETGRQAPPRLEDPVVLGDFVVTLKPRERQADEDAERYRLRTWVADGYRAFVEEARLDRGQEEELRKAMGSAFLDREASMDMPFATEADPQGKERYAAQLSLESAALARLQASATKILDATQLELFKAQVLYRRLAGVAVLLDVRRVQ